MKTSINKQEYLYLKQFFAAFQPLKAAEDELCNACQNILGEEDRGGAVFDYLFNEDVHNLDKFLKKYKIKVLK